MKLIMAIIKPFKLDEVREALTAVGVEGSVQYRESPVQVASTVGQPFSVPPSAPVHGLAHDMYKLCPGEALV